jgi:3D (Asp-Asp-Asp) domain-containing protein
VRSSTVPRDPITRRRRWWRCGRLRRLLVKATTLTAFVCAFVLAALAAAPAGARSTSYRLHVLRTAYCLRGHTATGTTVHWGSVAVDPGLIPLGTRLYVPGYGRGRAEDTGSAVQGRHVDVWVPSCSQAMRMTRYVTITVYR